MHLGIPWRNDLLLHIWSTHYHQIVGGHRRHHDLDFHGLLHDLKIEQKW